MQNLLHSVLNFALVVVFLGLGGMLLLAGRKYLWILLGAGGFLIAAGLAAEIQGFLNAWSLIEEQLWISLLIALAVGVLGIYVSLNYPERSTDVIGFAAGIFIAAWFDEILLALNGQESSEFTWWIALIFIIAGFVGVWVTRQDPDQAVILISVIVGASTIVAGLGLDPSSNFTAVIALGLTLTGVVVQYAALLRERPRLGNRLPPVPHPVSEELPY